MKKTAVFLAMLVIGQTQAAEIKPLWDLVSNQLAYQQLVLPKNKTPLLHTFQIKSQSHYQMQFMQDNKHQNQLHRRYQMAYKGVPIYGYQTILHYKKGRPVFATGVTVSGLEKELPSVIPRLAYDDIWQRLKTTGLLKGNIKLKTIKRVIYLKEGIGDKHIANSPAKLAYKVTFFQAINKQLSQPHLIIDANSGEVIEKWNGIETAVSRTGQGNGGNVLATSARGASELNYGFNGGNFQLGLFDIDTAGANCFVEDSNFLIINDLTQTTVLTESDFPVTAFDETLDGLKKTAFSYVCGANNRNADDTPVGGAAQAANNGPGGVASNYSPINDAMYFAQGTADLYTIDHGVTAPFGTDIPIRVWTYLDSYDNAFAISTGTGANGLYHQQIAIGNGNTSFHALTQDVLGHELTHIVQGNFSNMDYENQSGGMNEAFADMAGIALKDKVNTAFPTFWSSNNFTIGEEISLTGTALRSLEDPPSDGNSIDNAADYVDGMNVHFSSGVFNKAFYLIQTRANWSIQNTFKIMSDANVKYWVQRNTFAYGACGVMQAAFDRGWPYKQVAADLAQVGVTCMLLSDAKLKRIKEAFA